MKTTDNHIGSNKKTALSQNLSFQVQAAAQQLIVELGKTCGTAGGLIKRRRYYAALLALLALPFRAHAAVQQVTLESGLGYVGYFIIGMIMLTSLILIGVGGYQMSQDSGKGKMTVAAGVLIPVFLAVVYYIFKNVLKIDIDFQSTL